MMYRVCAPLLAALLLWFAPATAAEPSHAFDHAAIARATIDNVLRPKSRELAGSARELSEAVSATCKKPTRRSLEAARRAYKEAALAYARIEMLRFGPTREGNRQERLLLFPDPKGLVRRQVDKILAEHDKSVLSAKSLATKSVALQGFPALEILLYGSEAKKLFGKSQDAKFRCGYAAAIAGNIAAQAAAIDEGWADEKGYANLMRTPSADNAAYMNAGEVTLEIAGALINGLEQIRDVRLAGPLGLQAVDKAPTTAILNVSGLTMPYICANIDGLIALYRDSGIERQLERTDKAEADLVEQEMRTARDAGLAIKDRMVSATTRRDTRRRLTAMGFPLKNAKVLAGQLLAKGTGLSVGFNAGDGD